MYGYDNYGYDSYNGYDDYCSINEAVNNLENCTPTVLETVTTQDERTGEFKEVKVYNCTNCTNCDCPYFYEVE